jgi:hypothetical protein
MLVKDAYFDWHVSEYGCETITVYKASPFVKLSVTSEGVNVPTIVGAVVGPIAGVALLLLVFFLGWKLALRKHKPDNPPTQQLHGNSASNAASPISVIQDQAAWGHQQGTTFYTQQNILPELPYQSQVYQLPTDIMPPRELEGSAQYTYQWQTT